MKPVLILQHLHQDGPAYLQTWLERAGMPFIVRNTEAGDSFPASAADWSALAVLGGEMSANDDVPSLRDAERLIRDAMSRNVPVIGHCLGGQLMARALGAPITASPAPEIGWHAIRIRPGAEAEHWFGRLTDAVVFQWHYDSFGLPPLARWLAESDACPHQAFSIGPHLAMQFHIELDAAKLEAWTTAHDPRFERALAVATVQDAPTMLVRAPSRLEAQQRFADTIYARWCAALA